MAKSLENVKWGLDVVHFHTARGGKIKQCRDCRLMASVQRSSSASAASEKAWKVVNKDGTTPQQFIGANADCVFLVLPKKECEELCKFPAYCNLSSHSTIVSACWAHSDLGKALFSDVMAYISAEGLESTIVERIKGLSCETEAVTEAYLNLCTQKSRAFLQGIY
eukprot:1595857-Amphidinium_carterae.1